MYCIPCGFLLSLFFVVLLLYSMYVCMYVCVVSMLAFNVWTSFFFFFWYHVILLSTRYSYDLA